jgi:uncharacterized protein involved in outer membrane biogenesis
MTARRWIAAVVAALVALPLVAFAVAIIVVGLFGVSLDATRWREPLAARASAVLGRPVSLDGPLTLELGRETVLRVRDLRVLNPPGFATPELVTLGTVHVRIDLLEALRGRFRLIAVALEDGRLRLARSDDGGANWVLPVPRGDGGSTPFAIELERLSIRNLAVEHGREPTGARRLLEVEELVADSAPAGPLKLALRGRVREAVACSLDLEGAPVNRLHAGDGPWPFTLDLACARTRLHARGAFDSAGRAVHFRFGAGTEHLGEIERLLDEDLPELGAAALVGEVSATAEAIELAGLRGVFGETTLAGGLILGLGGARPRVTGELAVATLDLRPLLEGEPQRGEPLRYDDLARHPLPLRGPLPIDADVVLQVGRLLGLPGDVRDARLHVRADERAVRSPIAANVAGVPLEGQLALEFAAAASALALELRARNVPVGALAERFIGEKSLDGSLGLVALRLDGRGETLGALIDDLGLRLEVTSAHARYGGLAGGRPVELTLDAFELAGARGQRLGGKGRGTLLGEPIQLAIGGDALPRILRERATPIEVELSKKGATARLSATLARPEASRGTEVAFALEAPRAGDLARWLGIAPEATLPVAVRGHVRMKGGRWALEDTTLRLGRSELAVDAQRVLIDGTPVLVAAVRSPLIDVPELETLRPRPPRARVPASGIAALKEVPILPQGIDLADADIGLGLERVVLGRADLVNVGFNARFRDGRLPPSPCVGQFAGVPFEGFVALDLRGDVPEMSLSLQAREVDVGALLRTLGVAEIIDERAATLKVDLFGRGSVVRELLEHASLKAQLTGGDMTVRGPAERPVASIRVKEVAVGALPGAPVTVRIDGTLNETPATITASSGTLADFARAAARLPFAVEARAAGNRLALDGEVELPLGRGGALTLTLGGERLDSASALVRADLPPWGPWSIQGPIAMTPTGYEVPRLTVRVGESRLYGTGRLDLAGVRPRLEARISAPHIQLDDFPLEPREAGATLPAGVEGLRTRAREAADQTERLLSRAFLQRFDADVDVTVQQVLSGADRLADGRLRAVLDAGRLAIDPLEINVPGGSADLYAYYDTRGREVDLAAGARIQRLEYGILARRVRPDADLAGLFSLNMAVKSSAPSLDALMAHADGHVDFAIWPTNLGGRVFDRWSINVVRELLPLLDPFAVLPFRDQPEESQVNCVIGRLDLKGGVLTPDALVIDTTRVRALGAGRADFRTEEIAFRFRPRAKGVTFFSLQTPLSVRGTMSDFTIRPTRGDVLEALARFFAEVVVVPLEILFRGPLPRDGADVCGDPSRANPRAR